MEGYYLYKIGQKLFYHILKHKRLTYNYRNLITSYDMFSKLIQQRPLPRVCDYLCNHYKPFNMSDYLIFWPSYIYTSEALTIKTELEIIFNLFLWTSYKNRISKILFLILNDYHYVQEYINQINIVYDCDFCDFTSAFNFMWNKKLLRKRNRFSLMDLLPFSVFNESNDYRKNLMQSKIRVHFHNGVRDISCENLNDIAKKLTKTNERNTNI